jgi:hypothetical protein
MSALLLVLLTAGDFQHIAADGGLPELNLIPTDADAVAMLVSFRTGYGDDLGVTGLSSQAQTALTQANKAFPLKQWTQLAFAGDVRFYQTQFVLSAPRDEFLQAAQLLLPALLAPKLDPVQFRALDGRASPLGVVENEAELMVQFLEPLVLDGINPTPHVRPKWVEFARMMDYFNEFMRPANATVTIVGGFEPSAVIPLLTRHSGGTRRSIRRVATRNDVNKKVPAERNVHVIGYPLPELSAQHTASMRVIKAMLYDALTTSLRDRGMAYSISVQPDLTPWFNGVLLIVPGFDMSGTDLEPFLAEQIGRVVNQRLKPDALQRFREGVQLEDALARQRPASFVDRLASASVENKWLSPDYVKALADLTPEQLAQSSSALFVNERRRFYVKFTLEPATRVKTR